MSVAFFARIPKVVEFEKLVLRALAELPDKKRVYISQSTFQRNLVDPFVAKLPERPAVCKWNQTGISLGSFVRYLQSKGYVKLSDKSASFFITEVLSTEYVPDVPAASADGIAGAVAAAEAAAGMRARLSSQAPQPAPIARHSPTRPVARMSVAAAAAAAAAGEDDEEDEDEDEDFGSSAGSKPKESEYISAFQRIRAQLEALQKRQPLPQPQHPAPRSPQKRQTRAQTIDLCDDDQQPEKKRAKSGGIDEVGDDAITVACPFRGCPSQSIGIHCFAEHLLRCHADAPQEEFVRCPLCLYDPACDTQDDEIAHLIMHVHDAHPGFVPQSVARRLSELVGGIVQREFSDSAIAPFVLAPGPLAVSPAAGSSSVSPSASPAPAFRVDELTTDDKTGAECVICFCPFLAGERVARLECLCRFHEKCIRGWFAKSDGPRCCPNHPTTTTTTTPPSP